MWISHSGSLIHRSSTWLQRLSLCLSHCQPLSSLFFFLFFPHFPLISPDPVFLFFQALHLFSVLPFWTKYSKTFVSFFFHSLIPTLIISSLCSGASSACLSRRQALLYSCPATQTVIIQLIYCSKVTYQQPALLCLCSAAFRSSLKTLIKH